MPKSAPPQNPVDPAIEPGTHVDHAIPAPFKVCFYRIPSIERGCLGVSGPPAIKHVRTDHADADCPPDPYPTQNLVYTDTSLTSTRLTPLKIKAEAGTQGQSPSASAGQGKSSKRFEESKLEPELAAIARTSRDRHTLLRNRLRLRREFPPSIIAWPAVSAPHTASTISSSSGTTSSLDSSASMVTSVSFLTATAVPVGSVTVNSTPLTSSGTATSSLPSNAAAASNVVSFGPPSILAPTATRSSRYFGGSLSASTSGLSSASSSSSARPFSFRGTGADYAAETAAMETFNKFGNYREGTPKRSFDTTILESSGFRSPERPSYNPWKRQRKST
ncbi:hypothetical protein DFH08DRAFT_799566 [Mycena albidolilacea]|uniref:Uncharacterized protein n=1 Tax=Mycena albidolilacea TaxID=1033008 RepID=A0AAD7ALV1_9AGAR|nr:hypothetical protein DFH08DRAFT_799566 [Mycena albidolilacea]